MAATLSNTKSECELINLTMILKNVVTQTFLDLRKSKLGRLRQLRACFTAKNIEGVHLANTSLSFCFFTDPKFYVQERRGSSRSNPSVDMHWDCISQ